MKVKLKLPEGFRIERDKSIENAFYFYQIPNQLNKSNSFTSLKSLIEDCISYNDRLKKLEKIKSQLKSGFTIEVPINDSINHLYYRREIIASSGIIEELVTIADRAETNFELMNRLNNGEEIELNS